MRLIFFGTAEFAIPALEAVADHVVLVVSQPDRPSGRGMALKPSPIKQRALELGLPAETPEKAREAGFVERVRSLEPDALIVAAYGQILSESLLNTAKRGGINLHGSILPKYRGAAPIQRAILEGEQETGVTLMQMDRGMDSGDIIDIARTPIGPEETYGELQGRLAMLAARLLAEWLERIEAGDYPRRPQDHSEASFAPKVSKVDSELGFDRPATSEFDRYRAFTPSPGAFVRLFLDGHDAHVLKLGRVTLSTQSGRPGTVLSAQPLPLIAFAEGSLAFVEVQPEGKKKMSGRDWANGVHLQVGQSLLNA